MGAFADYYNTPAPSAAPAAPQEETLGDALRKGFDSGTTKAGADLNQLAGLGGEIVGANDFAQNRYAAAKAGRERAATEGPEINSLGKINSFGTALRFGAGQLGAMAPVAGAAIAGGVLARNPFIGGTLGLAPTNVGEIASRQMEDPSIAALPAGERGLRALAGGTAAAAVQNIGPGMFAGKVAGTLAGTEAAALGKQSLSSIMAKNVAEGVGVNAAGSGASEAISQYAANPDAPFNTDQIKDSAISGGVMGLPFGLAGGAAEGLRSRGSNISSAVRGAADAVGDKFGAAKDAAVEKLGGAKDAAVEGAGNLKDLAVEKYGEAKDLAADAGVEGRKKISSLSDDIGEMYARGRDSLNETFDKISKDEPLVGLKEFATEAGQKLSDSRAAQAVTDFATRASESAGLTPEMRQKLVDVAGNATDKTTQLAAVALKKTFDAGVFINTKLTGAYNTLRAGMDAENAKSGTKQSADYSGANRAIAEKLGPMLARREDITQRPDSVNKLVGVMRELASDPSKISVNSDTLTALIDTLGSDTGKMLDAAYGALQKDGPARPGAAEAFYQKLDEVNAAQKRAGSLKDLIGNSLTDEAKKSVPPSEYGSLAQTLSRVVRGEYGDPNAGPYQRKAQETQLQSLLTDHFGDKADAVLSRVRKESQLQDKQLSEGETSRGNSLESDKVNDASDAKFDESGNRIGESENDSRTFGLSEGGRALEGGKAVMDPDTFVSTRQEGKNNARQLITDLKVKYPDQDVRFERIPGSDMGHVIVEKAKNSEHFTDGDLKAMEIHKSRDYKNDPGLLEVGGRELDARKIASLAGKKSAGEGRADGTSRAQHLSDTFMDGIARLMEQHGNFSVRDAAVIGKVGGKDFTFGDAMKLQRDSRAEDRMSKAGQKELAALRKLYKTADPEIRDEIIRSVQKLTEKEKNKELAGGDDLGSARSENKPLTRGGLQGPERPGDSTIRPKSEAVEASSGSAQANAMARLTKAHERNQRKYGADTKTDMGEYPFENRDARYDDKGNLTKAGAEELLAGDYNGGIDVNGRSTHERDKTDFKDGEGRTELGKDENISRVMVDDKDAAFAGRKPGDKLRTGEELMKDRSDVRPNEDLVSRSNMDGSAKSVNDYANDENMKPAIGLKNQLLARDEAAATAIANRLGTLIENASILRAGDRFALSKLRADASPDQTRKIINPIAAKYADVIMAMKNGKQGKPAVETVRGADNKNGGFPDLPEQKANTRAADKGVASAVEKISPEKISAAIDKSIDKRMDYMDNPPDDYNSKVIENNIDWAVSQKVRFDAEFKKIESDIDDPKFDHDRYDRVTDLRSKLKKLITDSKAQLENEKDVLAADKANGTNLFGGNPDKEGTPSPKPLAAKKAALLEAASSSDPALIKELSTTDNARGLQRTTVELAKSAPESKASEVANKRMGELVQDPDTALNLTKKFSMDASREDGSREIMRALGFKKAPEGFADAAAKLLSDPTKNFSEFVSGAANGLSHILMGEKYLGPLKEAISEKAWTSTREQLIAKHIGEGMNRARAELEAYRSITEMALRGEIAARTISERTALGTIMQMVKSFVSEFKKFTNSADFADVVRTQLNKAVADAKGPVDLKANYKKVSFQEAVNADPTAAKILAHMSQNPDIAITGSIVLAHNGSIYRDAQNMLHDLDFVVQGSKEAAEAHMRKAFPDAVQIYDFRTPESKVNTFLVPPPGATIAGIERKGYGTDTGRVVAFKVMRDGKEIGRTWNDSKGEKKLGEAGTFVDLFTETSQAPVSTIPFTTDGKTFGIKSMGAGSIFQAKHSMLRPKDIGDFANFTPEAGIKFSADSADASGAARTDTPESRAQNAAYITKVLADSVKLAYANLTHAGEFERMRLLDHIRLATTALDPLSTLHHEALHAFFAQLKDAKATDITAVLEKAAASENVIRQLNERYAGNDAVLAQLKDPEERAAYMYQHWAAGDLKIGPQAKNVFTKIADYIRSVMGIWTNDQRATKILEYFNDGEYAKSGRDVGAARAALIDKGHNNAVAVAKSFTEPLMKLGEAVLGTGSGRLRDTNIPAIQKIADLIKRNDTDARGGDQGFIPAAGIEARKRRGALAEALQGYSPENLKDALQGLQTGQKASTPEGRLAQKVIKNTLQNTRDYLIKNGVDVGDLGPDYFPRVWDTHYISKNQQAFKDMLEPHVRRGDLGSSDDLMRSLLARGGNEFGIEKRTLTEQGQDAAQPYRAAATDRRALDGSAVDVGARPPGFQFKKERSLAFITPQEASMFVNKDLMGTLNSYISQATRKAEWTGRLGNGKLEDLFQQAREQGATPDQLKLTDTYLKGVDGTLGDNLNPHARRIMGNLIVYQNIRLLPFAAFSSVVDPAGVLVRGGSIKDAFATFKRGISEIPESFGRKGTTDHATYMSELVGVVDKAILTGTLGDIYTQGMVGGFAEKANNFFFKANLMEGLNRSFRIGATEAAAKFITRHADGKDSVHSARWIKELGLEQSDIKTTSDGHLALTREDGLSEKQVDRVHAALNQWVDGAVLRPDAADKPIWFNDPHFALISHLKQFTYAFQKVIIGRVVHEYKQGNYAPAMALASYVPIMLAADTAKGLIQGGGEQPDWKKGWDMADYFGYEVQRAGLLGVGQFGLDIAKDVHRGGTGIGALTGPTIEQFGDAVQLLGGHKQFGPFVLNALPANALYAYAFGKSDVADPMFTD